MQIGRVCGIARMTIRTRSTWVEVGRVLAARTWIVGFCGSCERVRRAVGLIKMLNYILKLNAQKSRKEAPIITINKRAKFKIK